jgi:competence protein ComGC
MKIILLIITILILLFIFSRSASTSEQQHGLCPSKMPTSSVYDSQTNSWIPICPEK